MAAEETSAPTKQERVHAAVRERILTGEYGPGFRVVIDALAAEHAVSAQPVREAVRRLEAEGLVVYRPNIGAQVAPADPRLFDAEMEVLALLEGYATAEAAAVLDEADVSRLREINAEMNAAMRRMDPLAFGRLNHEFHAVIQARCPNPSLRKMLGDVSRRLDAIRRTVFVQIPYRGAESVAEHDHLIALLETGAPTSEIESAAREHKLRTLASFRDWRGRDGV